MGSNSYCLSQQGQTMAQQPTGGTLPQEELSNAMRLNVGLLVVVTIE